MASGSAIAEVWVDGEGDLHQSGADIRDFFYRISLPAELRRFFGLRGIDPKLLNHPAARPFVDAGVSFVFPRLCVVPMGWSWAVHLTQVIHEAIFSEDDVLKRVKLLLSRSPSTQLQESDVGGIVYVDDSGCCGLREGAINRSHERYLRRVEELGLAAHEEKSHFAQKEDVKLGFRVDGIGVLVENREDRLHHSPGSSQG